MRWLAKAAVQGTISLVPRGETVNYYLQKNVSKRLPRPQADFDLQARAAAMHLDALERVRSGVDRSVLHCYEFGAGWDLIGPISMWALGVDRQTLVDIRPNIKLELVNDTIRRFCTDANRLQTLLGGPLRAMESADVENVSDLGPRFGITYMAPQDAASVPLDDEIIDFVSSTFTLEHIPAPEIAAILGETRRLMARDGIISSLIDMQDHYRYIDRSVSVYNFLRYRPWVWKMLNPGLQWQSRLRHSQYLELFEHAGYEVIFDEPSTPSEAELRELASMRLAPEFMRFSPVDLGTKATHLVARPRR